MRTIKAFVAKSFHEKDQSKTEKVESFLGRFRALGLTWISAEPAEVESVSKKVRDKIDECDIFVGILTRRHPIFEDTGNEATPGRLTGWTAPPWVLQESGYALRGKKQLVLLRETGVELPGLQGDLEYIPYDPSAPDPTWEKAMEMINTAIGSNIGLSVEVVSSVSERPEESRTDTSSMQAAIVTTERTQPDVLDDLLEAIRTEDLTKLREAEDRGLAAIRSGKVKMLELDFQCLCEVWALRCGDSEALNRIREFGRKNPSSPIPVQTLAEAHSFLGEHELAANSLVMDAQRFDKADGLLLSAVKYYRDASMLERALQVALGIVSHDVDDDTKTQAFKHLFFIYLGLKKPFMAFCFGEAALKMAPADHDLRFQLAYAYAEESEYGAARNFTDLAIFHYRLLRKAQPDYEVVMNNLGYLYSELQLQIMATRHYKMAAARDYPLGVSNLIGQYGQAGFLEEAKRIALDKSAVDDPKGLIPRAISSLYAKESAEAQKVETLLKDEVHLRSRLSEGAKASIESRNGTLNGNWIFPQARITLQRVWKQADWLGHSAIGEQRNARSPPGSAFVRSHV